MYDRKKMPNKSLRVGLVRLRMRCLQKKMVRLPCNPLFQRTCALFARDEWLDVAPAPPVRASRHPPCPRMLDEMAGPNTLHSYEVSLYSGESAGNASSASIISSTSCLNEYLCFQPSADLALVGSPNRVSTSVGRKYRSSTRTKTRDSSLLSTPISLTPSPFHTTSMPMNLKQISQNSRTLCCSPVANTKSSGLSCCSINHIPST
mmetsp:Transcript_67622/g.113326  ORF Transcript_67622/g.113326 Transcript_67622/m.113326 type:complete len:205 (+) Transcript_67622:413-1027(+)